MHTDRELNGTNTDYTATCAANTLTVQITTGLTRGVQSSFSAVCTDPSGNDSATSNTVYTESCSMVDVYEDAIGNGDSSSLPVDAWSPFSDTGTDLDFFHGTILTEA